MSKCRLFRIRGLYKWYSWYYFSGWIYSFLTIIDGIIEVITLNYIISDIAIRFSCAVPDELIKTYNYYDIVDYYTDEELKWLWESNYRGQ